MIRTLEQVYTELQTNALNAHMDATKWSSPTALALAYERINARFLAEWPEARARCAEARGVLGCGPLQVSSSGYLLPSYDRELSEFLTNRPIEPWDSAWEVLRIGAAEARRELADIADIAEKAFNRYAIAVAQGVAVGDTGPL